MDAYQKTDRIEPPIDSPVVREFDNPKSVSVTLLGGGVDIVAAPGTTTARLEVRELTGPPLTVTWSDRALKIEQMRDSEGQVWGLLKSLLGGGVGERPRARLTLTLPDDTAVSVKTVSADVLSGGSHGNVSVYTVSGGVTLDRPTGAVDVATVSGDVECASPSGELKVKTVSGGVTVQDAVLRTTRLNSVSGRMILDLRHGPTLVTANTVSGELSIRLPAGSGFDATVGSASGHVVVDGEPLIEDGKRGGHRYTGDRSVAIKARTVSGDLVVLRRDAGTAGARWAPETGPVIGDPGRSDIQDDLRRDPPSSDAQSDLPNDDENGRPGPGTAWR